MSFNIGMPRRARDVAAAILVFALAFAFVRWWDFTIPAPGRHTYQAVFLANGQTFFGRYYDRLGPYIKIVDPFYIQTTPDPNDPSKAPDTRVVRRGSELHAPLPEMLVPKAAVLFVEDLADTSPIAALMAAPPK
jgi:hypothetical protein